MIIKKIYNGYRNIRSRLLIIINKIIYGNKFSYKDNLYVRKNFMVVIEEEGNINIGSNVFFNNNCSLNSIKGITIGDNCIFGENVHIYDHNHIYEHKEIPINKQGFKSKEIVIGNNCWFGSNVIILKGVKIGNHCVVGANCTIHESLEDDTVIYNEQSLKKIGRKT